MYILVVGAGKIGVAVARWLLGEGQEVAVIDRDPARCAAAEEELGSISVVGDGTEAGVLAEAGANRADILIAATGMDDVNLVACQLASYRFNVRTTVSLVNITEHERLFRLLGITMTISTTDLVLATLQGQLAARLAGQVGEPG